MRPWMEENYPLLRNKKLSDLALPGTHDSGAYTVNYAKSKLKLCMFSSCINPWTITQYDSIWKQLESGIRALDLRVSYVANGETGEFYISHTFACIPLVDCLEQINRFLIKNLKEIVVLYVKADWNNRASVEGREDQLMTILTNTVPFLCKKTPSGNYDDPSMNIGAMIARNERVVLFSEFASTSDCVWSQESFRGNWLNKPVAEEWKQEYNKRLENGELTIQKNKCNQLSIILTPQSPQSAADVFNYVANTFTCRTLLFMAKSMRPEIQPVLEEPKLDGLNIISLDYPNTKAVDSIVKKNLWPRNTEIISI